MDEVEQEQFTDRMNNILELIFANHLRGILTSDVTMSDVSIRHALNSIDTLEVIKYYINEVNRSNVTEHVRYTHMWNVYSSEWRETILQTDKWFIKMCKMVRFMIHVENRFTE